MALQEHRIIIQTFSANFGKNNLPSMHAICRIVERFESEFFASVAENANE